MDVVSTEMIKPSSPTPQHLHKHKLSFLDQQAPPAYVSLLFFYEPPSSNQSIDLSITLKQSLSRVLTKFYPLAGRIVDDYVDCNDEGVEFVETRVHARMSDLTEDPDPTELQKYGWNRTCEKMAKPLSIQASTFDCGGVAVGACIFHKIGDMASLVMFMTDWSTACRVPDKFDSVDVGPPDFDILSSRFPPRPPSAKPRPPPPDSDRAPPVVVSKRFVFDKGMLSELKRVGESREAPNPSRVESAIINPSQVEAAVINPSRVEAAVINPSRVEAAIINPSRVEAAVINPSRVEAAVIIPSQVEVAIINPSRVESAIINPSRVEVVTAFLWGSLALSRMQLDRSVALHAVNVRPHDDYESGNIARGFGNGCALAVARWSSSGEEDIERVIPVMTMELRAAIRKAKTNKLVICDDDNKEGDKIEDVGSGEVFVFSSWCRFPVYSVDYGWGRPSWVAAVGGPCKNLTVFMDTKNGDGVEAWVNVVEKDMAVVELNFRRLRDKVMQLATTIPLEDSCAIDRVLV